MMWTFILIRKLFSRKPGWSSFWHRLLRRSVSPRCQVHQWRTQQPGVDDCDDCGIVSGWVKVFICLLKDWIPSETDANAGFGHFGSCCYELDIWEANEISTVIIPIIFPSLLSSNIIIITMTMMMTIIMITMIGVHAPPVRHSRSGALRRDSLWGQQVR